MEPVGRTSLEVRYQLWFEQLRDLAVFCLALAGSIITLLGTVFAEARGRGGPLIAVTALGLGGFLAVMAQQRLVDLAERDEVPDRRLRVMRGVIFALLGTGLGAFLSFAVDALRAGRQP